MPRQTHTDPTPTADAPHAGDGDNHPKRRALIAGYGPVGRLTADQLHAAGFHVTIIELNLKTVEKQLGLARHLCCYGNVCDPDVLEKAGIADAEALILAIPDENVAIEACKVARRLNPQIFIAARTNFLSRGLLARQSGADAVVVEEVVTAEAMKNAVVDHLING